MKSFRQWLGRRICDWLLQEEPAPTAPRCDFDRLRFELRPGDVVLLEGRSRISDVIKLVTQSPWTHSALYIGRLCDIEDPDLQDRVRFFYRGEPDQQVLVEALLGQGTIVSPLSKYRHEHLRICRPSGLAPHDGERVVGYCIRRLGSDYDTRQLVDLARFLFPWSVLPRRWRSSLFEHNAGTPTRSVCSCLLAEAFDQVDFPILPFVDRANDGSLRFFRRNPRLFAPRDFDYSPYFDIIKYPVLGLNDLAVYRHLPWSAQAILYNDREADFRDQIAALEEQEAEAAAVLQLDTEETPRPLRRLIGRWLPRGKEVGA